MKAATDSELTRFFKDMIGTAIALVACTAIAFVLAGCVGQGPIVPGASGQIWTGPKGGQFITQRCPPGAACSPITVSATPPGLGAYSYVLKFKQRSIAGIPYGEEPLTVYMVGSLA